MQKDVQNDLFLHQYRKECVATFRADQSRALIRPKNKTKQESQKSQFHYCYFTIVIGFELLAFVKDLEGAHPKEFWLVAL